MVIEPLPPATGVGAYVLERCLYANAWGALYLASPAAALGELVHAGQYAVGPEPHPSWALLRNPIHDGYAPVLEQFSYVDSSWVITPYTHEAIPLGALKDAAPGPLAPLPVAVEIIRELLATLSALHATPLPGMEQPLVHGRIGLSSVLVDVRGGVRLLPVPQSGAPPSHEPLAPEQGDGGPLTPATDVFLVGALLFTLVTGQSAFRTGPAVLRSYIDLAKSCGDLRLRDLVVKALDVTPSRRFESAEAFSAALEPLSSGVSRAQLVEWFASGKARLVRAAAQPAPIAHPAEQPAPLQAPPPIPELPQELRPWRETLQLFPPDLALGVGQAVRQVSRFLGPMRLPAKEDRGDPDGYRGITTRGRFERLLLSEWALALEIPEEFLRRAAMHEQLFTALAYRETGGIRRQLVLFDGGPMSLGRPRVAQLALLIALLERARAKQVRFSWGLMNDARRTQIAELTTSSVRRLLEGRSSRLASREDGEEWLRTTFAPEQADDLWLVGPRGIGEQFPTSVRTVLELSEGDEPQGDQGATLELKLLRPGQAERSMRLELPPDPQSIRLLRDPFQTRAAAPQSLGSLRLSLEAPPRFVDGGRRILVELAGGGLAVLHATSGGAPAARPTIYRPSSDRHVVAASWARRGLYTLESQGPGELCLRRLGPRGGDASVINVQGGPESVQRERHLWAMCVTRQGLEEAVVLDSNRRLWLIRSTNGAHRMLLEAIRVTGLVESHGVPTFVVAPGEGKPAQLSHLTTTTPTSSRPIRPPPELAGVTGDYQFVFGVGSLQLGAVRVGPDAWYGLNTPSSGHTLKARDGDRVHAACTSAEGDALLVSDFERRRLCLQFAERRQVLLYTPQPLRWVVPDPHNPRFAAIDDNGTLHIITLDGQIRAVWSGAKGPT